MKKSVCVSLVQTDPLPTHAHTSIYVYIFSLLGHWKKPSMNDRTLGTPKITIQENERDDLGCFALWSSVSNVVHTYIGIYFSLDLSILVSIIVVIDDDAHALVADAV